MGLAYMRFYPGDYLRKTRSLSPLKHGIYLLLILHCWEERGPAPLDEDELASIANCRSAEEMRAMRSVLEKYFIQCNDGWYHERVQQEIEAAMEYANAQKHRSSLAVAAKRKKAAARKAAAEHNQVVNQVVDPADNQVVDRLDNLKLTPSASASASKGTTTVVPGRAGAVAGLLRKHGVTCNPSNPHVIGLANAGIDDDTLIAAAIEAQRSQPDGRINAGYVAAILKRWAEAAQRVATDAQGACPPPSTDRQKNAAQRRSEASDAFDAELRAALHGIGRGTGGDAQDLEYRPDQREIPTGQD